MRLPCLPGNSVPPAPGWRRAVANISQTGKVPTYSPRRGRMLSHAVTAAVVFSGQPDIGCLKDVRGRQVRGKGACESTGCDSCGKEKIQPRHQGRKVSGTGRSKVNRAPLNAPRFFGVRRSQAVTASGRCHVIGDILVRCETEQSGVLPVGEDDAAGHEISFGERTRLR